MDEQSRLMTEWRCWHRQTIGKTFSMLLWRLSRWRNVFPESGNYFISVIWAKNQLTATDTRHKHTSQDLCPLEFLWALCLLCFCEEDFHRSSAYSSSVSLDSEFVVPFLWLPPDDSPVMSRQITLHGARNKLVLASFSSRSAESRPTCAEGLNSLAQARKRTMNLYGLPPPAQQSLYDCTRRT